MIKLFKILITTILIISMFPSILASASSEPIVNIKLRNYLGNQTKITVVPNGDYKLVNSDTILKDGIEYTITSDNSSLKLYNKTLLLGQFDTFSVVPSNSQQTLSINNRPYLGTFQFTKEVIQGRVYIRPINSVNVESYLRGVVPKEMPASWHKEALKAQTISARTYAMKHINKVIDDTISFQVYGGLDTHPNSDIAIKETSGLVLKYKDQLIDAVFSASNGGVTESNTNAWGSAPLPYFQITKDHHDPNMRWSLRLNKTQIDLKNKSLSHVDEWWKSTTEIDPLITANIKSWLSSNGFYKKDIKIVSIPTLSLSTPSSGGRVTKGSIVVKFFVKDIRDANNELVLQTLDLRDTNASKVRAIIGNRIIKSYLIHKMETTTSAFAIEGSGDGHGVGLSQWGAHHRAVAGQSYVDILNFYYPGTSLQKEYDTRVERLSGKNRYETNLSIAKKLPDHSLDNIIIVTGENYPDALTGASLSNPLNAAVLLINESPEVINAIKKESARLLKSQELGKVYLIGGTGVISNSIKSDLENSGFNVERISGINRIATAIEVAKTVNPITEEVFLAYGYDFPDALSVVPASAKTKTPILLNKEKDKLDEDVLNYLKANGVKKVNIIGGTGVVSNEIVSILEENQISVSRISGKNRVLTALEVADTYFPNSTKASIANGYNFPDALSGGSFAFYQDMPVLLTPANTLPNEVSDYIKGKDKVFLFGGKGVLSERIEQDL